ncbi:MAG: alpha/beta fold hydrolase [Polyangiales bacterium]
MSRGGRRGKGWRGAVTRLSRGAQNALELVRVGRLTDPYGAPYDVFDQGKHHRLRRYRGRNPQRHITQPILLVPPLMLTAEVYDIAEDVSAVLALLRDGADVWVCDFGAPEREDGGMSRTLDDHVKAVDACVDAVRQHTNQDVHLGGYSQGGMFCYQVAAYRRSEGLAGVITFGSPVDIHRNLPNVGDSAAAEIARLLETLVAKPISELEGLPGILTSTGFKLVSFRKEVSQVVDFFSKLHDRQALERREGRRRFLGGEGFVAWPGPAFRTFFEEFIVHNRMMSGGFVIDGRSVTLADVTCPVLFFVGERDDLARPASVRAVRRVVPPGQAYEVSLPAGHFGLVIGSKALAVTWPTVLDWMRWHSGQGTRPRALREEDPPVEVEDAAFGEFDFDVRLFIDAAKDAAQSVWSAVGDLFEDAGDYATNIRWQLPRISELETLDDDSLVGFGRSLAEQAERSPERTFFLWRGRAFTYSQADARVNAVVRGLWLSGVRPGERVLVCMGPRPSYLTLVAALSRIGAVPVLVHERATQLQLRDASQLSGASVCIVDPARLARAGFLVERELVRNVFILGGGAERDDPAAWEHVGTRGVVDLEAIDVEGVELPSDFVANPGRGSDLAMIFFTPSRSQPGGLRAAEISGRRWAFSALGAAAACTLTPDDTVYVSLPMHHIAGLLVSVGGALVGGARLALADSSASGFPATVDGDPSSFWEEVRRYGSTVVFYAGESARSLTNAPFSTRDANNPVRLFAGSGMRSGVWRELESRFRVSVVEFYASTEVNAILTNASGEKIGSVGQALPGSAETVLVRFDPMTKELTRKGRWLQRVDAGEPGVLLARTDHANARRGLRDAFESGDAYFVSGDVLVADEDGDHRFIGRLGEIVACEGEVRSVREIEDALDPVDGVLLAVARIAGHEILVSVAVREGSDLNEATLQESLEALPDLLRDVRLSIVPLSTIRLSDGFRPLKT